MILILGEKTPILSQFSDKKGRNLQHLAEMGRGSD
jgi:hypothetical protein